jgi:hypothetical protein
MEIISFNITPDELDNIEKLLSTDTIDVKKLMTYGTDNTCLLVFYEKKEDQLSHEGARLEQLKEVADSVRNDTLYSELKNANQRCLYLLEHFRIPKSIALDVIDEVKVLELTGKRQV